MNDMSLSYNSQTENTLPALVSGSPETSTNNQIKINNNRNHVSTVSTDSSACEAWEKLSDSENSGFDWKDTLQ
ncbi:Uncharacterized protein TCM_016553 [Theobroma cacao]|uniref:Uncharacterized protein n=1 Tax=Theobroma cacao TaxID=3641 RepID=A0A061G5M0_THECC|nr:Uncharacterized protein TCM_016553 [Theobroma cacao]